jgi:dUTP pyrophosphatase
MHNEALQGARCSEESATLHGVNDATTGVEQQPTAWVSLVDPDGPRPDYATEGAVAFDLAARESVVIQPRQIGRIPTNVIVQIPDGYCLLVALRSSTPSRLGLIMPNAPGIIDRDFAGPQDEILVQVLNITDGPVTVERGTRVAQAMFVRTDRLPLVFGGAPIPHSRGGFGSTG